MLSNIKLLYNLNEIKEAAFSHFDKTVIENCWVAGDKKTVHVSARIGEKEFNAWGTSTNEVMAIGIALMELIERAHLTTKPKFWRNLKTNEEIRHENLLKEYSCLNSFLETSSGLAAHLNIDKAINNSLSEIIERHVITKASLCNLGFQKFDDQTFISLGPLGRHVVIKRHRIDDSGYLYGTSASKNIEYAIDSADNELAPQVKWSENSLNLLDLSKNFSVNRPSGIQQYNLTHDLDIDTVDKSLIDHSLDESNFWFSEIEILPSFRRIKSLKITRAFSPKLQPFYFGPLLSGPLNHDALVGSKINPKREFNIVA